MRTTLVLILLICTRALAQDVVSGDAGKALDDAVRRATWGQFWGEVMVQRDGELLLCKGYGIASRDTLAPITADSLVDLASVSKAFTAVAILRLEMDGKLSTDDPISRHLPGVPEDKASITVHHLLTHTAGLGENVKFPNEDDRDKVVAAILAAKPAAEPGKKHSYSNAGYFLLAAIVEHVSGAPYDTFVRDEVCRRAGMTVGAWHSDPSLDPKLDTQRITLAGRAPRASGSAISCPYPMTWGYRGSGGIVTSARQMYAWDRALRADELLAGPQKARMFTPFLNDYAYGWEVRAGSAGGRVASHSGGVAGYSVWFTRWLDRDACVFVVTNGQHDVKHIHDALVAALFPDESPRFRATFNTGQYEAGEHGLIRPPNSASAHASGEAGDVVVSVSDPEHAVPLISIRCSSSTARELAAQIRHALGTRPLDQASAFPPLDAAVYTRPYTIRDGRFEVGGDGVILRAMPGTPHQDPDSDRRVSIVIIDEPNRFWPMILKLDRGVAAALASEVEALLR